MRYSYVGPSPPPCLGGWLHARAQCTGLPRDIHLAPPRPRLRHQAHRILPASLASPCSSITASGSSSAAHPTAGSQSVAAAAGPHPAARQHIPLGTSLGTRPCMESFEPGAEPSAGHAHGGLLADCNGGPLHATLVDALKHTAATAFHSQGITYVDSLYRRRPSRATDRCLAPPGAPSEPCTSWASSRGTRWCFRSRSGRHTSTSSGAVH